MELRDEKWKTQPSDTGGWMICLATEGDVFDQPVTYIGDFMTKELAEYIVSIHNRAVKSHARLCGEEFYRDCRGADGEVLD